MLFKVNGLVIAECFPHSPVHTLLWTRGVADATSATQNSGVTHLCSFWVTSVVPVFIFLLLVIFLFLSNASAHFRIILHNPSCYIGDMLLFL